MRFFGAAILLLLLSPGADAGDETREEWLKRMDEQQFSGDGNRNIAPRRDLPNSTQPPAAADRQPGPPGPRTAASDEAAPSETSGGTGVGASPHAAASDAPLDKSSSAGKAAAKASSMAKALTHGTAQALGGSDGGAGAAAGGPAAGRGPANEPARASDPSRPRNEKDLVAAEGPYNASFKQVGVRVGSGVDGRPELLDAAGRPASPAQVAALRERIATEPRALMRRPDFYQVLPRQDFQALKGAYVAGEGSSDPRFRHIALTEPPRDFVWKESCKQVSGQCNPLAKEKSYDKGADVSPETLSNVMKDLKESSDAGDSLWADYVKVQQEIAAREAAQASQGGHLREGFSKRLAALASGLGWGGGEGDSSLDGSRGGIPGQALGIGDAPSAGAAARGQTKAGSGAAAAKKGASPGTAGSSRRLPLGAAALGGVLLAGAWVTARRRALRPPPLAAARDEDR